MSSRRASLLTVVPIALLVVVSCGNQAPGGGSAPGAAPAGATGPAGGGKVKVVATTTQIGDFAAQVGGDRIELTTLLRANVDPHDYEASPADVKAISEAAVVLENGVELEKAWLGPAITSAGFRGTTVDASRGITLRPGNGDEKEADGDPHIWHSPANAAIMVRTITDGLVAADPPDAAAYEQASSDYQAKLTELDAVIKREIESIPPGDRKVVTNHDAFGYYLDRYGLTFEGSIIPSFDTQAAPSGKQLADLVATIKATGTKAIFSESSLPGNTAENLAREAGVTVVAGEDSLYGDTLGPPGSAGATYLEMERHNTETLVRALKP